MITEVNISQYFYVIITKLSPYIFRAPLLPQVLENYYTFFPQKKTAAVLKKILLLPYMVFSCTLNYFLGQGISITANGLQLLTSTPNKTFLFPFEHVAWPVDTPLMSQAGKDPAE